MKSDTVKRTPLEICSFAVMVMALTVLGLTHAHIFGIGILSWIIPGVPEPHSINFYSLTGVLSRIIIPLIILFCFSYVILRPLKNVLARKHEKGYRPELILIVNSLVFTALTLMYSENYIQPSGAINEYFITIAIVLGILGWIFIVITLVYRFIIDKERIKDETNQHNNTDSRQRSIVTTSGPYGQQPPQVMILPQQF